MAQQSPIEVSSRRAVGPGAYLVLWAIPAVLALGYLISLAWNPHLLAPDGSPRSSEQSPALEAATRALAEVDTVRKSVDHLQGDMKEFKDTVEQQQQSEEALQTRLAALEEKVSGLPNEIAAALEAPSRKAQAKPVETKATEKPAAKAAAVEKPAVKPAAEKQPAARSAAADQDKAAAAKKAPPAPKKVETGSISQAGVGFGEPVVTKAGQMYAVQLDVAPSIDVLRLRWNILVDQHGSALSNLQPRFVAPHTPGAPYRLLAGPLATPADARAVCRAVKTQQPACSTSDFIGDPLL